MIRHCCLKLTSLKRKEQDGHKWNAFDHKPTQVDF